MLPSDPGPRVFSIRGEQEVAAQLQLLMHLNDLAVPLPLKLVVHIAVACGKKENIWLSSVDQLGRKTR